MKKCLFALPIIILLLGCEKNNGPIQTGIALRERLLNGQGCSFRAAILADCNDLEFSFAVLCDIDQERNFLFTVESPNTISGISGNIAGEQGTVIFDDTILTFPMMANDELSPICAPWIFYKSLEGGFIHSAAVDGERTLLTFFDSYEEDALQLDVWLDENGSPVLVDIMSKCKRLVTIQVEDFHIL